MARFGPLVDGAELAALVDAGEVVVADVRWYLDGRSGRAAYEAGHIPGAVFVDLDTVLAAPPAPPGRPGGRHPLPSSEEFVDALGAIGIGDARKVVAYDDAAGSIAARLWWMLRAQGREAAVLDGGIDAWPGPLESGPGAVRPAEPSTARPWPDGSIVDADAVDRLLASGEAVVVDARAPERYRGDVEPVDARPGHIPGAVNAPWAANVDPSTGRLLAPDVLRARFAALGADGSGTVVAYCGSGVTACHDLLACEVAGLGRGVLYPGSWSDWAAQPERPAAIGPDPTGGDAAARNRPEE